MTSQPRRDRLLRGTRFSPVIIYTPGVRTHRSIELQVNLRSSELCESVISLKNSASVPRGSDTMREAGLLAPAARISGRRDYGQETVDRLRLVLAAQQASFTLAEIRESEQSAEPRLEPVSDGEARNAGRDYLATTERAVCFGLRDRLHLCSGYCGLQACQGPFTSVGEGRQGRSLNDGSL